MVRLWVMLKLCKLMITNHNKTKFKLNSYINNRWYSKTNNLNNKLNRLIINNNQFRALMSYIKLKILNNISKILLMNHMLDLLITNFLIEHFF